VNAYIDEIESPAGPLAFAVNEDGALMRLHFVESDYGPVMEEDLEDEGYAVEADETRTARVRKELSEYVSGRRKTFDVPLAFAGSVWQKAVWMELTRIPFGETRSYGEIADNLGRPGPSAGPTLPTYCLWSYPATVLSLQTARSAGSTVAYTSRSVCSSTNATYSPRLAASSS
jgi:O6-methylguanine-DNA--protein-cysteine methyltransferase